MTSDLPTPKYSIGQTVWHPTIAQTVEPLPCPDCFGSKKWAVTTPAGLEMETPCQRCSARYTSGVGDLPKPERIVFKAGTERLTVGGIRAGTQGMSHYGGNGIEYMCRETGIGSGSVYTEDKLHETEEAALTVATIQAAEKTEQVAALPDQMKARTLDNLTIECAVAKEAHSSKWSAWFAYRHLAEDVAEAIKPGVSAAEKVEAVETYLEDDRKYRELPDIGRALEALRKLCPASPEADEAFKALMLPEPVAEPGDWLAGAAE